MQFNHFKLFWTAFSLGLSLAVSSAADPAEPVGRRQASSFSSLCTDIALKDGGWLVGTCPTDDGSSTVTSSVFLPSFVTNHEASLEWGVDGNYIRSCSSCELISDDSTLYCFCDATHPANNNYTSLNLEEYISVYDGFLLTSLSGAPTVPTASSSVPVPDNLEFSWAGWASQSWDTCPASPAGASDTSYTPETCTSLAVIQGGVEFFAIKMLINEGWQVTLWSTDACSGDPLATFDYTNATSFECVTVAEGWRGFTYTPLWNADY